MKHFAFIFIRMGHSRPKKKGKMVPVLCRDGVGLGDRVPLSSGLQGIGHTQFSQAGETPVQLEMLLQEAKGQVPKPGASVERTTETMAGRVAEQHQPVRESRSPRVRFPQKGLGKRVICMLYIVNIGQIWQVVLYREK